MKPAYLREDVEDAARPKRGRPSKQLQPEVIDSPPDSSENTELLPDINKDFGNQPVSPNLDSKPYNLRPRKTDVAVIDFSKPPPPYKKAGNSNSSTTRADPKQQWSASQTELEAINRSIRGF